MGRFLAIVKADLKVLFRQYHPEFMVPVLGVFVGIALFFQKDIPPTIMGVLITLPLINLYERMFSRTENEAINYHLVPSAGKPIVAGKNASAAIMFLCISVPAIVIPCVILKCEAAFTVRAVLQAVVVSLFLLLSGNIISVRTLEKKIAGYSFVNGFIMGLSISIAVVLNISLSAILGHWAGAALCVLIPCVMYAFSLKETASSIENTAWGLLEGT